MINNSGIIYEFNIVKVQVTCRPKFALGIESLDRLMISDSCVLDLFIAHQI
jgi:hypothetical protein